MGDTRGFFGMIERTEDDEELLTEWLLDWQDAADSMAPKSATEICGTRIDLVPELERRIAAVAEIDRLIVAFGSDINQSETLNDTQSRLGYPRIQGYQILTKIGQGGMGIVFKALQEKLNRIVAIKIIRGGRWGSPREVERFKSEAELLAKVHHPGVVQIFDIFECDGVLGLVLEFVNGKSLMDISRLRNATTTPDEAAKLAREIATIMAVVHAKGVLHRDIKPANILIDVDGHVKITDFGIAKALTSGSKQTMTGDILGTPGYMAPEQVMEKRNLISERADIYSIGATLYEMLTGRTPFAGASVAETLSLVVNEPPVAPRLLVKSIPESLETICLKCLEKEPDRRYASAAFLRDDLDRFLQGHPIHAKPVSTIERGVRWCRRNPEMAAMRSMSLLGLILVTAGATWFWTRLDAAHKESEIQKAALRRQEFHTHLESIKARAFSHSPAWIERNVAEIQDAAILADTDSEKHQLRNEAIRCFSAHDVRSVKTLATDIDAFRAAHHPTLPILVIGENRSIDNENVLIRVFNTDTFEEAPPLSFKVGAELPNHDADGCRSLVFSPTGDRLIAGSRRGNCYRWRTASWSLESEWKAHDDRVMGIAIHEQANTVFTASRSGEIRSWRLHAGNEHISLRQGEKVEGNVHGLCLTPISLVIMSDDCCMIDYTSGSKPRKPPVTWNSPVTAAATVVWPGSTILVGHKDRLTQFELSPEREVRELRDARSPKAHSNWINSVQMNFSGRFAVSADDAMVKVWDFTAGTLLTSIPVEKEVGKAVEFLPDGKRFVVAGKKRVELYEIYEHPAWEVFPINADFVSDAAISKDGKALIQLGIYKRGFGPEGQNHLAIMQVRNLDTGAVTQNTTNIGSLDDEIIVSADSDKVIWVDKVNSAIAIFNGTDLTRINNENTGPAARNIAVDRSGKQLYFVADDTTATGVPKPPSALFKRDSVGGPAELFWSNIESARRLRVSEIWAVAAGNRFVASSSRDGMLRIHDAASKTLLTEAAFPSRQTSLAMISDSHLVAGDELGTIRLLKLPECIELQSQSDHRHPISGLVLDDSHRKLVSACEGGFVRFWELDTTLNALQPSATLGQLSGPVKRLACSGDGNTVLILVKGETAARLFRRDRVNESLAKLGLSW